LAGVSIAIALFGLSKTVWQMILFRCCAGVFAGTVVTIRAMISENSTHKTQARAFSLFAFFGNVGIFLGPLIGGGLSKPADQYPSIFGQIQFFKDYPYALPTFVAGAFATSACIISAIFVKETLDRKGHSHSSGNAPMSVREILKTPGVVNVIYIYGHVGLLACANTASRFQFLVQYLPKIDVQTYSSHASLLVHTSRSRGIQFLTPLHLNLSSSSRHFSSDMAPLCLSSITAQDWYWRYPALVQHRLPLPLRTLSHMQRSPTP